MSNNWIFNEGSSSHRGVWHLIEGDIRYQTIPEKIYEYTSFIYLKHKRKCSINNRSYYDYTLREYIQPVCDCGISSDPQGIYTTRYITPEHTLAYATVVCSAFTGYNGNKMELRTGGIKHRYPRITKANPGDTFEARHGILEPMIVIDRNTPPPGPYCSRCYDKINMVGVV